MEAGSETTYIHGRCSHSEASNVMFFAPLCVVSVFPVMVFVPIALITASVKALHEYPRAVVFTLRRLQKVKRARQRKRPEVADRPFERAPLQALANKMTRIIWALLTTGGVYRPNTRTIGAASA